jgi:hypothetical protein
MAPPRRDISVVICAYTAARWHDLVAAVQSVRGQSVQPRDIIVVKVPYLIAVENQEATRKA